MGYNNLDTQQKALVSMSNGDVYKITETAAIVLEGLLQDGAAPRFIKLTDPSGEKVAWVNTRQISSLVVMEAGDGRG